MNGNAKQPHLDARMIQTLLTPSVFQGWDQSVSAKGGVFLRRMQS